MQMASASIADIGGLSRGRSAAQAPRLSSQACFHASKRRKLHVPRSAAAGAGGQSGRDEPVIDVTWASARASDQPLPEPDPDMDPAVREALLKVSAAFDAAQETLERLEELPSARLPTAWDRVAAALKPAAQAAALAAACAAIHSCGVLARVLGSLLVALFMGWAGWRKGSLSASGALAAILVGWGTLGASLRGGVTLLAFFFVSSKLTRLGDEEKALDEEHKAGGQRDWKQVACNGAVPTCLALAATALSGGADLAVQPAANRLASALSAAFLGYYACCCGDTWASELGQLSPEEPILITSLRPVRRGTNGGVTLVGLAASLAGGLFTGLVFFALGVVGVACRSLAAGDGLGAAAALARREWRLVLLGLMAGLVGSLLDSLLGATVQFTGYNRVTGKVTSRAGPDVSPISGHALLDNNGVNCVSASLTAALTALACLALF